MNSTLLRGRMLSFVRWPETIDDHSAWRYEEDGRLRIAQVSRAGCEVILSDQWPQEAGGGRLFISLDRPDFAAMQAELAARGAELTAGRWGYELVVVEDLDGNRLWFPHPQA